MKGRAGQLILGFILIAVLGAAGWYLVSWLFRSLLGLDKTLSSAIIAAFVAVFSLIFAYWKEREKARQEVHRERKVEAYSIFFDMVFKILRDSKRPEGTPSYAESSELHEELFQIMRGVLAYGSPNVVLAMGRWRLDAGINSNMQIKLIGDILLAMRKDLGLSNRGLTNINIHQIYVNDDVEALFKGTN
jgi:hypothetical protein